MHVAGELCVRCHPEELLFSVLNFEMVTSVQLKGHVRIMGEATLIQVHLTSVWLELPAQSPAAPCKISNCFMFHL